MAEREPYVPEFPTGGGAGMAREPERSTTEVLKDIVEHSQELIRSEIRLARVEIREEIAKATKAGSMMGAGGVIALYGLGFFIGFIVAVIAIAIPMWASLLAVSGFLLIVGLAMISAGRKKMKSVNPTPDQTIQSVKEDAQWLRNRAR